jgi:hypothetical protein
VGAANVPVMTRPTTPEPLPATATTTTTLTARSPEDLLAAAAVVLGFWPTESVVMLTFDAEHPFHARIDLPRARSALPDLARTLVQPAVHHRVGRVVVLVHTAERDLGRAAWRALRSAFRRHGIDVVEALLVGADRFHPLLADGPASEVGVPFDPDAIAAHPFLAQAVLDGRVLHRSRGELAAGLVPDPVAVARVEAIAADLPTRDPGVLEPVAAQLAEGAWAHDLVTRHLDRHAAGDGSPSDADVARLLCGMQSLRVRDAAWSAITRARARPAAAFFADVLRRAPAALVPAAAALVGWAAWQSGDGALAWCAIDRVEAVDPAYGLARLLAEALERAMPPSVWTDGFDWKEGLTTA